MSDARDQLIDTMNQLDPQLVWALTGLTEPQRYWQIGTSNPIAETAFHMTRSIDRVVMQVLQGKPQIWEAKVYGQKLSTVPAGHPTAGMTPEQAKNLRVEPWSDFVEYVKDVMAATKSYLKESSDAELETVLKGARMDTFTGSGDFSKMRVLRGRISHASMHLGEIFAQRGAQGLQGAP